VQYRLFDRVIHSEIPLPDLPASRGAEAPRVLVRARRLEHMPAPRPGHHHVWKTDGGDVVMRSVRVDAGYVLEFPSEHVFLTGLEPNGLIAVSAPPGEGPVFRHLLCDQVLPRVLSLRDAPVLHAAAVAGPAGAIVLAGASGSGKSTLAADFWRHGWQMLGDDAVMIRAQDGRPMALAGPARVRLAEDARQRLGLGPGTPTTAGKQVLDTADTQRPRPIAAPLRGVVVMHPVSDRQAPVDEPALSPVRGAGALHLLMQHILNVDPADTASLRIHLEVLAAILAAGIPVLELVARPGIDALARLRSAVVQRLGAAT